MPSPFLGSARRATSQAAPERPAPIAPVPEETYRDDNNAYRGIENHGVDGSVARVEDHWGLEGRGVVLYAEEDPGPPYLGAVSIVGGKTAKEFKRFRTDRRIVGNTPSEIVGRSDERTNLKITNMSTDKTVYLAANQSDLAITGYPLGPGKDFTTPAEDAVYMVSVDGTDVPVAIIIDYTVSEK